MLRFSKAHAYGNDFLYVRKQDAADIQPDALTIAMCDRHSGIGADGLIVYEHDRSAGSASMQLFNADGGRAEVSGNGVRALAALLLRDDPAVAASIDIHTAGGVKRLTRTARQGSRHTFRADMGSPADLIQTTLQVDGEATVAVTLNMGNPQCVVLGPLPDKARFERLGAALAVHPAFPEGTNVEFAEVERPDRVRILVWERGVGPTTSSGTGSCAALVAAAQFGGAERDAEVVAPGGSQRVEWTDRSVVLTGWAEIICDGEWTGQIPRTR
jgi:diaminopimelate epimerase